MNERPAEMTGEHDPDGRRDGYLVGHLVVCESLTRSQVERDGPRPGGHEHARTTRTGAVRC